jgi:hypothetical protein
MPAMFLLYIGLTALALLPGGLLPRIRLLAVTFLATLQITSVLANAYKIGSPAVDRLAQYTGSLRGPETSPDPAIAMLDGLLTLGIRSGFVIAYTNCLMGTDSCNGAGMPIFEHVAVSTLALERRLPIYMHYFGMDLSHPETLAKQIRSGGADYVLVDMFDDAAFSEVDHTHPYFQLVKAFIEFARNGFPPGFTKLNCATILRRPMCAFAVAP